SLSLSTSPVLAGNALTSSSYVGPAGTVAQPIIRKRAARTSAASVAPTPARAPLREAAAWQPPPTTSPFLNLFRPEASPIFNYYTLVRPQLEQERVNQLQAAEIARLQQLINSGAGQAPRAAPGGRFMNRGGYFGSPR
ncbi:MAG: hypothetical protein JNG90_06840, partial [Planctomycetaceae bacterium]|nr:hypothetical protein [Planctomycetaceae bacterium]